MLRYTVSLLALLLTFLLGAPLFAQVDTGNRESRGLQLSSDLQSGLVVGGQISNEQFVYKSGFSAQMAVNTKLSPWLYAGLGVGVQALDTETIIPVFVDFKAHLKESERTSFLGLNVGASSGQSTYYRNFADYDYHGGFYFSPYYSFQFPIDEDLNFLISTGYIHQIGWVEYFTAFDETYLESFTMDFLTIRAGIRFK